jgi:hypothetical protein
VPYLWSVLLCPHTLNRISLILKHILTSPFHLPVYLTRGFPHDILYTQLCIHFSSPPCVQRVPPILLDFISLIIFSEQYNSWSSYSRIVSPLLILKSPKEKTKQSSPATRHGGSYSFLTSGGEWSVSRPGRALSRRKDPRYPLYRGMGGPQSRSGHRRKVKILCPCRGSNPDRPVRSQALYWLSYPGSWSPK